MQYIVGLAVGLSALALIIFPEFRKKLYYLTSGFLNLFVEDVAKTPDGAAAIYNEAIEIERNGYRKAKDIFEKTSGELADAKNKLQQLEAQLHKVESECENMVRNGRRDDAIVWAQKRQVILDEIADTERKITEYAPMVQEAHQAMKYRESELLRLQREKKRTVAGMKLDIQTKEIHRDMDELRADSTTKKMLGAVTEKADDLRKEATGARLAHQSLNSTKVMQIESRSRDESIENYLSGLQRKVDVKQLEVRK